jgi:quaternary ammonium compound-resistance protein SugE
MVLSLVLLGQAARSLPIGAAYAVWAGTGAFGTALLGIVPLGEPADLPRLLCLGLIGAEIIGPKLASPA